MGKRGIFITLEGGEGAGKSTQIRLLSQSLTAAGIEAVLTREPGGTPEAERLRDLIVQRDSGHYEPLSRALMLMAGRHQHIVHKIRPALETGQWVISDRFVDSTRVYQVCGEGLDPKTIETLYGMISGGLSPDLTLIFDIDPKIGLGRSNGRLQKEFTFDKDGKIEDHYERQNLAFHQRLRQGYLDIARKEPQRCVIIDAAQSINDIHRMILKAINDRLYVHLKEAA